MVPPPGLTFPPGASQPLPVAKRSNIPLLALLRRMAAVSLSLFAACSSPQEKPKAGPEEDAGPRPHTGRLEVDRVEMPEGCAQLHRTYEHGPDGAVTWSTWVACPQDGDALEALVRDGHHPGGVEVRFHEPDVTSLPAGVEVPATAASLVHVEHHYFRVGKNRP